MSHKRKSFEETKLLGKQLFQLNPVTSSRYDYRVLLSQIIPHNSMLGNSFPPDQQYYRVVLSPELPQTINQFSYNPKVNFRNRGALENEPIFYCSNDLKTALCETNLEIGGKYIVGEWTNLERFNILSIGFESRELIALDRTIQLVDSDFHVDLNNKIPLDDQSSFVNETIVKIFLLEKNDYNFKLINYTAEYIYQSNGNSDAFAYPPVKRSANGINYSMRISLIDNKIIVCRNAMQIEITNIDDAISYRILNFTSIIDDTKSLVWLPIAPSINYNTNEEIYFWSDDNGVTHGYDGNNNLLF